MDIFFSYYHSVQKLVPPHFQEDRLTYQIIRHISESGFTINNCSGIEVGKNSRLKEKIKKRNRFKCKLELIERA